MNNERTTAFLMGNLGVEVERFYTADSPTRKDESLSRIMRIVDSLKSKQELRGRTGEIDILCDIIADHLKPIPQLQVSKKDLQSYFMPFAMRALAL